MSLQFGRVLIASAALAASASFALAADIDEVAAGRAEYRISCMACHGEKGEGDGPMAKYLTIKPADISVLSQKNDGKFPFLAVFQTIDGRAVVKTHGDGPMPIWGNRYSEESGAWGAEPYKSYSAEAFVRARILELTYFIQTLQK